MSDRKAEAMATIEKQDLRNRALSIQGHVGAVARMIEEDAYCVDIIKQTQAVQKALDRLNSLLLERHLGSCVTTAIRSNKPKERERVINELLDVFDTTAKL
ncbi:MAG: metal-sensitive transcriptional regulator [Chloroflexi bacterium]|nr:metal-sensitive transcriptional regulator [Chloroflexota bacterium]